MWGGNEERWLGKTRESDQSEASCRIHTVCLQGFLSIVNFKWITKHEQGGREVCHPKIAFYALRSPPGPKVEEGGKKHKNHIHSPESEGIHRGA